jgi:Zn-dependent protease with chaperone function
MMFVFRATIVTLGFFGVLYCLLSLLVVCAWRSASLLCRNSAVRLARLLFALRIFPLLGAALVTLTFALPAFALLEGGMDEDMGTVLFSVGTLLLFAAGLFRMWTAQAGASRVVAKWLEGARVLYVDAAELKLQARLDLPPLLLYGVSTPKVLVSEKAVALLSPDELRAAVRHEVGHVRSRDNLKKLIIYGLPFPGMSGLERSWQEAAEFAADEAAVSNSDEAIDLASALIKLSDLVPLQDPPLFTTGLVNIRALVRLRVERLLAWDEASSQAAQLRWWRLLPLVLLTAPHTAAHYGQALLFTHRITEWFIH